MSIRRILLTAATLLSAFAIVGTTTDAMAAASPQAQAITVQAAHTPQNRAVTPDFRCLFKSGCI
jgi:hypothetical protein